MKPVLENVFTMIFVKRKKRDIIIILLLYLGYEKSKAYV